MGLRYRKSINLGGGFRINFSKSGVGYSFGGKGFRYTKTARGTNRATVSIPGTGISWVEESGKTKSKQPANAAVDTQESAFLFSVENGDEIVSTDFAAFLNAIKHFIKINKVLTFLPLAAFICFIVGTVQTASGDDSAALLALSMLAFVALLIWKAVYCIVGPVKANYDLSSPEGQYRMDHLQKAMDCLKDCAAVWQVNDVYANNSTRRHGGAGRSVNLTKLKIQKRKPFFLRSNVKAYFIKLKKERLYILPDVIIIEGKKGLGVAALKDLDISIESIRFVETTAPKDAKILSYTWQYVNNDGTPDKRFKNNVQLPVCQYGLVDLKTNSGFHTRLYLSNIEKTQQFSDVATEMVQHAETLKQE